VKSFTRLRNSQGRLAAGLVAWILILSGLNDSASAQVAASYSQWQTASFSSTELTNSVISGDSADPDGDGIPNLLEYAMGLDPKVANPSPLKLQFGQVGGLSVPELNYTMNVLATDVTFTVEESTDLVSWGTANIAELSRAVSNGVATVSAQLHPTQSLPTQLYVRLSVSQLADWNRWHTGYATYTGSGYSGGAALLDPIAADMEITALNSTDLDGYGVKMALAGAYLKVVGPKGSTIVYVTDLYPEGAPGALDLCPISFSKLGDVALGKIDIQWQVVAAPISGNFSYRIKEGSSQWWAAVQMRNHKFPVLKMAYYQNGTWVNMEKQSYNHFLGTNMGLEAHPIRLTDIRGQVVTDILPPLTGNATNAAYFVQGNVQFP
jgi:expansin